ncbi:MAG TPA: Flp pilus assembly protein CpaB, partial [Aliiroseovarius sp.]|nr:Flp pilus assembly protein CpaB [Aliiroseovarius sp.]
MRLIFGLVLILGVGLAGFAVYMARNYIGAQNQQLAAERALRSQIVPTTAVFVVKDRLAYGDQLTVENIEPVRWPVKAVPPGAFTEITDIFPDGEPEFRTVLRTMEKGEAVLVMKVSGTGADAGVASRLGKGMRAFTINVDVSSGVSGFLRPGDRVDVYWSGRGAARDGERRGGEITRLIQNAVQIIAIDHTADSDRSTPTIARTITVEASPTQVAALAQAPATGKPSLSLAGPGD